MWYKRLYRVRLSILHRPKTDLELALILPAFGTLIGCFIGATLEALDWEMPWQVSRKATFTRQTTEQLADMASTLRSRRLFGMDCRTDVQSRCLRFSLAFQGQGFRACREATKGNRCCSKAGCYPR